MNRLQMLDCSTGHLSPATRTWLDGAGVCEKYGFMSRDTGYAISTYIGDDANWPDHGEVPRDLVHVLRYGHANGMDWVLFDVDAERDPNLPWYDDMSGKPELPDTLSPDLLTFSDKTRTWAVEPRWVPAASLAVSVDRTLEDENYAIPGNGGAWIGVAGTAVRIKDSDGHLAITVLVDGYEMDDPLSEIFHARSEIALARQALEEKEGLDGPGT